MRIDVMASLKRPLTMGMLALAMQATAPSAEQPLSLPPWLANYPQAHVVSEKRLPWNVSIEYSAPVPSATVLTHYKQQLQKTTVTYSAKFDGIGTAISTQADGTSCVVRIAESDNGSSVRVNCTQDDPASGGPRFSPILPPPPPPTPTPTPPATVANAAPAAPAKPAPVLHKVEYSVTGSVYKVVMFGRDAKGVLEKEVDVRVPYYRTFDAAPGTPVFLSAEKLTDGGSIHTSIRIDGVVVKEKSTTKPFGLAEVGGVVPN